VTIVGCLATAGSFVIAAITLRYKYFVKRTNESDEAHLVTPDAAPPTGSRTLHSVNIIILIDRQPVP
jgi:hypothetical protein